MAGRIIKLVLGLSVIATVLFVFHHNPERIAVRFGSSSVLEATTATVLIVSFCSGVLVSALFAFIFGVISAIRDWRERKKRERIDNIIQLLISGREHLAAGNFRNARETFRRALSKDPANVLARAMLAETVYDEGDIKGALSVLDEARQAHKDNVELLFLGAAINAEDGNYTAAFDNLQLVLKSQPKNIYALRHLTNYAEKIDRLDDAIQYQETLIKELPSKERDTAYEHLAQLELDRAEKNNSEGPALEKAYDDILRRHRDFPPALVAKAEAELENGKIKSGTKLLERAYRKTGNADYLQRLADTWLSQEQPSQALGHVRDILADAPLSKSQKTIGTFCYIGLLLHLEMVRDAARELEQLSVEDLESSDEQFHYLVLRAKLVAREGNSSDAFSLLVKGIETVSGEGEKTPAWNAPQNLHIERKTQPPLGLPIP